MNNRSIDHIMELGLKLLHSIKKKVTDRFIFTYSGNVTDRLTCSCLILMGERRH